MTATPRPASTTATPVVIPLKYIWLAVSALMIGVVASSIGPKITWYLAVDQYGYLAFAHDLASGRIFHHWPPLEAFARRLPEQVDVLSQTYVYDHGRLYCRYAPGFAIVLAGWLLLFGDDGAHYLNPTIYIVVLALLLAFQVRLFRGRWRATVGVALVILCPSMLHLWGITLTRDLCAHLFGLIGLFLLLPNGRRLAPGRALAAGMALGFTISVRPDGVLYLVPATLVTLLRFRRDQAFWKPALRVMAAGGLGALIGVAPFLAYNWIATGNPFRPTQGMELQHFLPGAAAEAPPVAAPPAAAPRAPAPPAPAASTPAPATPAPTAPGAGPRVGYPPGAWIGGTMEAVQGGGLKLANLPTVLPGNFNLLRSAYGDVLLGVALLGALVALVQRRMLFCAAVPYVVLALFFYSCWTRPDGRYLAGIHCLMPILIVEGLFGPLDLMRRFGRGEQLLPARWLLGVLALALMIAVVLARTPGRASALPTLAVVVPLVAAAAAAAAATFPRRRIARFAVPGLAVALVAFTAYRSYAVPTGRAAFQRPQMLRARATLASLLEPKAVVISTEEIGRPGENIDYYSGVARAFYITDLMRWRITIMGAATMLENAGWVPYLLLPATQEGLPQMLDKLRTEFNVDLIAKVSPQQAMSYFVAAPFHRGIPLELYRLKRKPRG
jgi:hypothetical protein